MRDPAIYPAVFMLNEPLPRDDGEPVASMEPLLPSATGANRRRLEDLAVDLTAKAHALAGQLHANVRAEIGALVRSMNCYYSNLIEGHNTHPVDIERALRADYSANPAQRALQLEARAHIEVQTLLDGGGPASAPDGFDGPAASSVFIQALHREFCRRLPDDLLWVENPDTGERMRVGPGELRSRHVKIGRHVPVSPGAVPRFLARIEAAYRGPELGRIDRVVAVPAAHHRLLWIHPFLDGNGRVARLVSHTMLRETGVGTSLWSVSRGLARNTTDYKRSLMAADAPRRDDVDGRGALSEAALTEFCEFFLRVCVDQVEFMAGVLEPATLLGRIEAWLGEEIRAGRLHPRSPALVREAFQMGGVERGRVPAITGLGERQARNVLAQLIERRVLASASHRAPVRLLFPEALTERWLPNLYPGLS
jgi:Fic family protein